MTETKLNSEGRRNWIVSLLGEAYPGGVSRSFIMIMTQGDKSWGTGRIDNALHHLKKSGIVLKNGLEYSLRTAPESYNQKLVDEVKTAALVVHRKLPNCPECLTGVVVDGECDNHLCETNERSVRAICSVVGCENTLPPGMKMCNDCIEAKFDDPVVNPPLAKPITGGVNPPMVPPMMKTPPAGVKECPNCERGMPVDFDKCLNIECPSNQPKAATAQQGDKAGMNGCFNPVDVFDALKDLERKLNEPPATITITDLGLKLGVLDDLYRLLDARIKPVLEAIASDLVRASGKCEHSKGLSDYCEQCGRVSGGEL